MKKYTQKTIGFYMAIGFGLALFSSARADFLITYNFNSASNTPLLSSIVTGTDAASVDGEDFTAPGNASVSGTTDTAFINTQYVSNTEALSLETAHYFSLTISAINPGEFVNLDSFSFEFGGSNNDSGTSFTSNVIVQSSVGGFNTGNPMLDVTPSSKVIPYTSGSLTFSSATVDVSDSAFDNLDTIEFQFRFHDGGEDSTNTFVRLDNIVFAGSVIPEPSSMLLVLSGVLAFGLIRRGKNGK